MFSRQAEDVALRKDADDARALADCDGAHALLEHTPDRGLDGVLRGHPNQPQVHDVRRSATQPFSVACREPTSSEARQHSPWAVVDAGKCPLDTVVAPRLLEEAVRNACRHTHRKLFDYGALVGRQRLEAAAGSFELRARDGGRMTPEPRAHTHAAGTVARGSGTRSRTGLGSRRRPTTVKPANMSAIPTSSPR